VNRSKLFAWAVVAGTALLFVLLAIREDSWPNLTEVIFWVALLAGAELLAISLGASAAVTMGFPIHLAVAIVFRDQPTVAMLIAGLGAFDALELRRDIALHKALFNRAVAALSVGAMLVPLTAWPSGPFHVFPMVAAAVCYLVVELGLIAAAIRVETLTKMRAVLTRLVPRPFPGFIVSYGLLTGLGAATAIAYIEIPNGGWAVAAILIPLLFARVGILAARGQQELSERLQQHQQAMLEVTQQLFKERERERERIAVEIHDSSLQSLAAAAYACENGLQSLGQGDTEGAAAGLRTAKVAVNGAMVELRGSLVDLRTTALEEGGLAETVDAFALQVRTLWGREVDIENEVGVEPPIPVAIAAVQILQEGVTNALKHSERSIVRARLTDTSDALRVIVEDEGPGFNLEDHQEDGHLGLKLMDERAVQVGGKLEIQTSPGSGTRVVATLPLGGSA
jgi:signal transduction histidine kinase